MQTLSHLLDLDDGKAQVGAGSRVLVADDERDTALTLGILLSSEGFAVRITTRGEEVPLVVHEFDPDLVLLDIGMPDRTGYDLAQELRARYGDACPLLIAVTAHCNPSEQARAKLSGFHHHIGKPYNPVALIHFLSNLKRRNPD